MNTAPPDPPPYGVLIERARRGAGLSIQKAATAAGVSKASWIDIVRGYRKRGADKPPEPTDPRPETIARMAYAAGLSPERLRKEGDHPGAADILAEIQMQAARSAPEPEQEPPPPTRAEWYESLPDDPMEAFRADPVKQDIWALRISKAERGELIDKLDELRSRDAARNRARPA